MDSWIWIVLLVGLFWFMRRSGMGCCGGHSHSHEKDTKEPGETDKPHCQEESREVEGELKAERR